MGIRGLTKYIQENSYTFIETYQLHDINVVIDGDSLAKTLYFTFHDIYGSACFGGDYDKYAKCIESFFDGLEKCKVTPYIIFDGGHETEKLRTIFKRREDRITSSLAVNPASSSSGNFYPAWIGVVFEDIVLKRKLNAVRTDFENDLEVASVAKYLNCPLIAKDGDYYMFNIKYISIDDILSTKTNSNDFLRIKLNEGTSSFYYIQCKIFRNDKFLNFLRLTEESVVCLPALLSNDYVKKEDLPSRFVFTRGFSNALNSSASFIRNKSKEEVIRAIVDAAGSKKQELRKKLEYSASKYTIKRSQYMKYLGIGDTYSTDNNGDTNLPPIFLEKYRTCQYDADLMDILNLDMYTGFTPQVDNPGLEDSHLVSLNILSVIHKILVNDSGNELTVLIRVNRQCVKQMVPYCKLNVPCLSDIQEMDLDARKVKFIQVLELDKNILDILELFPNSWKLLVITVIYLKAKIPARFVYTLILSKIILSYVDKKIGFYRKNCKFEQEVDTLLSKIAENKSTKSVSSQNPAQFLAEISYEDSVFCMKKFIGYFKVTRNSFNKDLVQNASQFQSCYKHLSILNDLFNHPFSYESIYKMYNGTFIYNFSNELFNECEKANLKDYVLNNLKSFPSVYDSFVSIIQAIGF